MIRKYPSKKEEMEKMEAQFDEVFERAVDKKMEAPVTPRVEMLREVELLVSKNRNIDYGEPVENMARTAEILAAYMGDRTGRSLEAQDVAVFGIILKLGRLAENPLHKDSVLDIAGYASILFECIEKDTSGT
tara:strand:- start:1748 stop:2143 length:396 start_codon:yes stop_codon:yes gene_type:complete